MKAAGGCPETRCSGGMKYGGKREQFAAISHGMAEELPAGAGGSFARRWRLRRPQARAPFTCSFRAESPCFLFNVETGTAFFLALHVTLLISTVVTIETVLEITHGNNQCFRIAILPLRYYFYSTSTFLSIVLEQFGSISLSKR